MPLEIAQGIIFYKDPITGITQEILSGFSQRIPRGIHHGFLSEFFKESILEILKRFPGFFQGISRGICARDFWRGGYLQRFYQNFFCEDFLQGFHQQFGNSPVYHTSGIPLSILPVFPPWIPPK